MTKKFESIKNRLTSWKNNNPVGPYSIQLNPTNRCNLECRFCWQRTGDEINYDEVSDDRYLDLIDEARALGAELVEITGGGEPLIRKNLILSLIKKIKENRLKGKLITNGTAFINNDLSEIVDAGWDEVIFSVDGTRETHDYLRQKSGCFQETIESIKILNNIKEREKSDKPTVTMHTVLCNKNYDEIKEIIDIANAAGCDSLFVEPVVTLAFDTGVGKELKFDRENKRKAIDILKDAEKAANNSDLNNNFSSLKEELITKTNQMDEVLKDDVSELKHEKGKLKNTICFEPWYNMIIRAPGMAGPCCMFDNEGPNIKENSLEEIWFGKRFSGIRNSLLEHELLSFCSKCNPSQVTDNRNLRAILRE